MSASFESRHMKRGWSEQEADAMVKEARDE